MTSSVLRRPAALFTFAALLVVTACAAILRIHAADASLDVAAWGATFDLTITIPLLYWFFVVRTGRAKPLTIAPLFVVCTMAAGLIVPRGEQQFLHQLGRAGGALAELLLIGALTVRVMRSRREKVGSADPAARIAFAARTIAGEGRVADVIASEVTMFYYALFGWGRKAEDDRSSVRFTFHERNGWSTILVCILVMLAAESLAMHLFIAHWRPKAAWIWTALDVWGVVWLLGDYHALRLRPSAIDDDVLHLRYGLRWSATVPLADIVAVDDIRAESEWRRGDVLKVAILDEPRWLVTLREPVVVHGLAGMRKRVGALALLPDDEAAIDALRAAIAR